MFFGKINQARPNFKMGNTFIHCAEHLRYLGVTIDEKLSWRQHIDRACDKARKMAQRLRVACKLTWGLTRDAMKTIYLGAIEPGLTYGAAVWGNNLRVREINKLRSVQRIMAIGAASAYRTVSTDALLIIGDLIPIEEKIVETSRRWWTRSTGKVDNSGVETNIEKRGGAGIVHPAANPGIVFNEVGREDRKSVV